MFNKLFGKNKNLELVAPFTGKIIPIEDIPDPVFSDKMVGDGIGIEPTEGILVAPCDAEVAVMFPTKHAVGLKTESGVELLLHIGLETVGLNGEGFTTFVEQGDKVEKGQKLVTFDLQIVRDKCKSIISPVVVSNSKEMKGIDKAQGTVTAGQDMVMTVHK